MKSPRTGLKTRWQGSDEVSYDFLPLKGDKVLFWHNHSITIKISNSL